MVKDEDTETKPEPKIDGRLKTVGKWDHKKAIVAKEIARHGSISRASRKTGVPTAYIAVTWLKDIEFLAEVRDHRNVPLMLTCAALTKAGPRAVKILDDALAGFEKAGYSVTKEQVAAARIVLDVFRAFADMGNLSLRLATLEEQMSGNPSIAYIPALPPTIREE